MRGKGYEVINRTFFFFSFLICFDSFNYIVQKSKHEYVSSEKRMVQTTKEKLLPHNVVMNAKTFFLIILLHADI